MMWWRTLAGKPVWIPAVRDFKSLPRHRADAYRMFMSGVTTRLLRAL